MGANGEWIGGEPRVLVFDVNETLIDFESMDPLFEKIFGDRRVMREWLSHLIMYSMTITLSGLWEELLHPRPGTAQDGRGRPRRPGRRRRRRGDQAGHADHARPPRRGAGPDPAQGRGFSHGDADELAGQPRRAEPARTRRARAVLRAAVQRRDRPRLQARPAGSTTWWPRSLAVPPSTCFMVGCHVWDTVGAQSAGYTAGLITRPGNAPLPVASLPQPNLVAPDLPGLADQLIQRWRT